MTDIRESLPQSQLARFDEIYFVVFFFYSYCRYFVGIMSMRLGALVEPCNTELYKCIPYEEIIYMNLENNNNNDK